MNAREAALRLNGEGLRVLPIQKETKRPLLRTWDNLKTSPGYQSPASVAGYRWDEARADALGVINGLPVSSGSGVLIALDLDHVSDRSVAADALDALGLPSGYPGLEKTPHGFHVWVYVSGSVNTERFVVTGGRLEGVEVRGTGAQTVMYGPLLTTFSTGSITTVSREALRTFVLRLGGRPEAKSPPEAHAPRGNGRGRVETYLRGEVPEGARHAETLGVASILREMGVDNGEAALAILRAGYELLPQGRTPYTVKEFETDVRSAWNYSRTSPGLPAPTGSTLHVWTPDELRKMDVPPTKFLLKNFLLDRGLIFLSGETGAGKSMLSLTLALDISGKDRERFLNFPIERRGTVIYVDIENPAEEIRRRIGVMNREVPSDFILITPREGVAPGLDEILRTIEQVRKEREVAGVFVDGVYLAGRGRDESSQKDVLDFLLPIQTLTRDAPGILWVPLHKKKGGRDQRADVEDIHGSNVFGRVATQAFSLRRNRGPEAAPMEKVLRMTKVRSFSDEGIAKAYLLETRPGSNPELYFVREIDEDSTLQQTPGFSHPKKSDFDIAELVRSHFGGKANRRELLNATRNIMSRPTLDRVLEEAVARKELERGPWGYMIPRQSSGDDFPELM